jgi:hypothetical protein
MRMIYFSEIGVNNVIDKYQNLIGGQFYFNNEKNGKTKLIDIFKGKSILNYGFLVLFLSEKNNYCSIDDFMKINKIEYNFDDFNHVYIDI